MKCFSLLVAILSFVVLSCQGQNASAINTIDAKTFSEKITATPRALLLDVRTPGEFSSGHIDQAINNNWLGKTFVAEAEQLDKSMPIFVYCKSGVRSQKAAEKLHELGFKTIYQLEGGMLKWDAAGLSQPSAAVIGISNQEFTLLLQSDKKVLISFYAEWCAPCKKMTPYLLKMQKKMSDKLTIIRLDADKNKTIIADLKISELPTLLLYDRAKVSWKHSGYISEEDLNKQLQ